MKKNQGSQKNRTHFTSSRRAGLILCKKCKVFYLKRYGHDHTKEK